ncbi:hypothetical protein OSTOST_03328 [Ostertagia ostertagi]
MRENDLSIEREAETHGDILQNIAAMRYVAGVCTNVGAVLKIDDDVAWDVMSTASLIDSSITEGSIRCSLAQQPAARDSKTPRVTLWCEKTGLFGSNVNLWKVLGIP